MMAKSPLPYTPNNSSSKGIFIPKAHFQKKINETVSGGIDCDANTNHNSSQLIEKCKENEISSTVSEYAKNVECENKANNKNQRYCEIPHDVYKMFGNFPQKNSLRTTTSSSSNNHNCNDDLSNEFMHAPISYSNPFIIKHRNRTTPNQLALLEKTFLQTARPCAEVRKMLAEKLNMTPRAIQIWFQNRRAKAKNKAKDEEHINRFAVKSDASKTDLNSECENLDRKREMKKEAFSDMLLKDIAKMTSNSTIVKKSSNSNPPLDEKKLSLQSKRNFPVLEGCSEKEFLYSNCYLPFQSSISEVSNPLQDQKHTINNFNRSIMQAPMINFQPHYNRFYPQSSSLPLDSSTNFNLMNFYPHQLQLHPHQQQYPNDYYNGNLLIPQQAAEMAAAYFATNTKNSFASFPPPPVSNAKNYSNEFFYESSIQQSLPFTSSVSRQHPFNYQITQPNQSHTTVSPVAQMTSKSLFVDE